MGTSEHAVDTVHQDGELLPHRVRRSDATSSSRAVLEVMAATDHPAPVHSHGPG
jgi:hypothetical protein